VIGWDFHHFENYSWSKRPLEECSKILEEAKTIFGFDENYRLAYSQLFCQCFQHEVSWKIQVTWSVHDVLDILWVCWPGIAKRDETTNLFLSTGCEMENVPWRSIQRRVEKWSKSTWILSIRSWWWSHGGFWRRIFKRLATFRHFENSRTGSAEDVKSSSTEHLANSTEVYFR